MQTEDLVIRGTDRNEVILDGGFETENGMIIFSDGVAVENLTVRNYTSNGLFWTGDYDADRILLVNLGPDLNLTPLPEPLLAPPAGCTWETQWSSERLAYGGSGEPQLQSEPSLRMPAESAALLRPVRAE